MQLNSCGVEEGGGVVLSDYSEETSRNLGVKNYLGRSCTLMGYNKKVMSRLHQGHFKVFCTHVISGAALKGLNI